VSLTVLLDALVADLRSRYGLVGLLRPLTVYPSEMVYWFVSSSFHGRTSRTPLINFQNLPTVSVFQGQYAVLHVRVD